VRCLTKACVRSTHVSQKIIRIVKRLDLAFHYVKEQAMKMQFTVRPVSTPADQRELTLLHRAIVQGEFGGSPPAPLLHDPAGSVMHFIARAGGDDGPAVGSLTVVETSHDEVARRAFSLPVPTGVSSAFYTCVAVVPEYRGLGLPVRLLLEARKGFVEPRRIRYTWLLYDAARAESTRLCRIMNYRPLPGVVNDLGRPCRVLFREEPSFESPAFCSAGNSVYPSYPLTGRE
jgi:GNAT superfamily N-acetyltransferase